VKGKAPLGAAGSSAGASAGGPATTQQAKLLAAFARRVEADCIEATSYLSESIVDMPLKVLLADLQRDAAFLVREQARIAEQQRRKR
jgi:hypothetical protein